LVDQKILTEATLGTMPFWRLTHAQEVFAVARRMAMARDISNAASRLEALALPVPANSSAVP
jgi:hypothetical protein